MYGVTAKGLFAHPLCYSLSTINLLMLNLREKKFQLKEENCIKQPKKRKLTFQALFYLVCLFIYSASNYIQFYIIKCNTFLA